jgi:hypothetical protein
MTDAGRTPVPVRTRSNQAERSDRLIAGVVAAACLALLTLSALITPSAEGHGTHTQLGLPPCGFAMAFNRPCPTCGMTTSFAHAVRGELGSAVVAQPFGAALAIAASIVFWLCLHTAVTGSRVASMLVGLLATRVLWGIAAAAAAAWVYKWVTWPR